MTERFAGDRGRRLRRFLLAASLSVALAVAISGCVVFRVTPTSTQQSTIGGVQITTTICASDKGSDNTGYSPADSNCQGNSHLGNSGGDTPSGNYQVMLGYRIPSSITSSQIPSSFTTVNTSNPPTTPCGAGTTFNQSSSLASQLQSLDPAPNGEQWVGYISVGYAFSTSGCQYMTAQPTFGVNQGASNAPFQGPFTYRVVVGGRSYNDGESGSEQSRTVTCGSNLFGIFSDGNGGDQSGICIDDPSSSTTATDLSQNTQDLGVVPTNASVHAGATATVPFNLKWSGAASPASFNVAASTTVSGTTVTPSITTITPAANSNNNMTVSVPVPAGTTPGSYQVTVTVTGTGAASGQTRTGTATLTVGNAFDFDTAPALPALGTITLNGQSQTTTAKMNNFSVNDTTASPSGWNVTVAGDSSGSNKAVFSEYCPGGACGTAGYVSGGKTLAANSLTLNSTGASWTGGTGSAPTFQCNGGNCPIDSATPTKIASAANGSAGTGLWSTTGFGNSSVSLSTPSTLRVLSANKVYRLNVVWTLNSGP